jgi:voltage-gated potassium channel
MPIYRVLVPGAAGLHRREWRRRVLHTLGLLLLVLATCAIGLIALDSTGLLLPAKIFRGLWNALNLVTTLGAFSTLDEREKLFMMATMVVFLMVGGYALSSLTGILSSEGAMALRENRVTDHRLGRLANHVIVIGFGTIGRLVASRLHAAGEPLVVVDRSESLAAQAAGLGHLVVQGDAGADDAVLDHSGVEQAKALVVTTEDPDRKLAITLMAHSRNPKLMIVVTASSSERGALLRHAGASEVVMTEDLVASTLVDRLEKDPLKSGG